MIPQEAKATQPKCLLNGECAILNQIASFTPHEMHRYIANAIRGNGDLVSILFGLRFSPSLCITFAEMVAKARTAPPEEDRAVGDNDGVIEYSSSEFRIERWEDPIV